MTSYTVFYRTSKKAPTQHIEHKSIGAARREAELRTIPGHIVYVETQGGKTVSLKPKKTTQKSWFSPSGRW
jgi:hypothetical protein